ncbi:GAF and ANTAR domain-containing protein [Kribbella deserti]|uniref:GAF and ANTAR domain-containing protein n=1 Tax=Kribbella deserti TaxID=1926257 RepID=A0ABV6QJG8_9ACTN
MSLDQVMADIAAALNVPIDLDDTLRSLTSSAVENIPDLISASLSVTHRDGSIKTVAPTDSLSVQADQLQYLLGEGPCVRAALEEPVVIVPDMATDPRWPVYGPKVAEMGVGAQVAFQFRAQHDQVRGALNLYFATARQIDDETLMLGRMYATHIAIAMGWARHEETLNEAILTRNVIGQAVGVLMERYKLDADRAFDFLVRTSQTGNVKLRVVAEALVAETTDQARR